MDSNMDKLEMISRVGITIFFWGGMVLSFVSNRKLKNNPEDKIWRKRRNIAWMMVFLGVVSAMINTDLFRSLFGL